MSSSYGFVKTVTPTAPTTGQQDLWIDAKGNLQKIDETGTTSLVSILSNVSVASQVLAATTLTYLTGTALAIPPTLLKTGTRFKWKIIITKTAAGSASSTFNIRIGTAGTTADTSVLSFVKPAGTAAADEAVITIEATILNAGATANMVAEFSLIHNLATTGHATTQCVVLNATTVGGSSFDATVANLIIGISATTGASDAITVSQASAEAIGL